MPESAVCLNAKGSLEKIVLAREVFYSEYDLALSEQDTREIESAYKTGLKLKKNIQILKDEICVMEGERRLPLKEQYDLQVNLLDTCGFLRSRRELDECNQEREILFIEGIDGRQYPLPSIADIHRQIVLQKEKMDIKIDQGFTRLALVPFGMSLDTMADGFRAYFLENFSKCKSEYPLDRGCPLQVGTPHFRDLDKNGTILYYPKRFGSPTEMGANSKAMILETQNQQLHWSAGWNVILLQAEDGGEGIKAIVAQDAHKKTGTIYQRYDIECGNSPDVYIDYLPTPEEPDARYAHESGMTSEDWMMASIIHFEKTNTLLDNACDGIQSSCYLTGVVFSDAWHPAIIATWNRTDRLAYRVSIRPVDGNLEGNASTGTRHVVRL